MVVCFAMLQKLLYYYVIDGTTAGTVTDAWWQQCSKCEC